jgi:hypothetical protein
MTGGDIQLAVFPRGRRGEEDSEQLKIQVREYEGKKYLDLRIFFRGREGDMLATKKGLTLRVKELDQAIAALQRARSILNGGQREIAKTAQYAEEAF